ncbi:MAG: hypothetical protein A3J97_10515 [Spirochaetes bacterium RIFOXYC1_FULL_54_7]|nr:MAG: hypothetical protein A3J97_10515 [Spirochaetes bacterium RIFOXYC1_FULL_54_7]
MKPTVALLVLVLYCLPLQAEPLGLSLDEAMELAVANSQVIHDQENVVAKALRNMDNSWNLYLPGVTADLIASYKDSIFYPSQTSRSVSPLSTSLKMDIKLSLDTKSLFERKKRGDDYATALLLAQEVQRKFVMGAEKDYFSLVASSLDVNNSLRTLDLDEELYRQTKVRFERGLEPELSLLNADLKLQGTRTAVMSSQAAYDKKAMAFRRLIGLEPQIMFTLTTPLAFTELDAKNIEDLLRAIEARLDLEIKRMAIEASTVAINRYHAITRLPLLSLGSSLSYGLSDFSVPSDGFSISAGISFGVDAWIPGSQKDLAYRLLLEEREQQVVEYDRMLEAAKEKVEDLTIDLSLKINDLRLTEAKLALAERIHAQTRTAYDRGTVTLYTLDDAQNKVEVQRQALVSTKLAYLQLVIDIGYALGVDWRSLIGLTS